MKTWLKYLSKVSGPGREGAARWAEQIRKDHNFTGSHGMNDRSTCQGSGRAGSGMTEGCWELEMSKAKGVSVGEDCRLERGQVYWHRAVADSSAQTF